MMNIDRTVGYSLIKHLIVILISITVCLILLLVLKYQNNKLTKKIEELEEENYTLEQNNIDLKWQLGEIGNMCQGSDK